MHSIGVFACVFDEQGRVLCVRENYGERLWAMPGGRLGAGEDPVSAIEREAMEEAAGTIRVRSLVGVYAATHLDDVVLLFVADLISRKERQSDAEISEVGIFPIDALADRRQRTAAFRRYRGSTYWSSQVVIFPWGRHRGEESARLQYGLPC